MPDSGFTAEQLIAALAPRTVFFYEQIGSTNDTGLALLGEHAVEGTIVVADEQTNGRGRLGRHWYSPPGSLLMFTYLLRPPVSLLSRVGMLGALAVCEAVEQLGIEQVGIKWPNDVQIEGCKLCGVLPEARWDGGQLVGVSLGIGINVRTDFTDTPFATTATSLEMTLGQTVDRLHLLSLLLDRLDFWSERLGNSALFEAWRGRLNMLNLPIEVQHGAVPIRGIAQDVDSDGALLVRDGEVIRRVMAGDIALG